LATLNNYYATKFIFTLNVHSLIRKSGKFFCIVYTELTKLCWF